MTESDLLHRARVSVHSILPQPDLIKDLADEVERLRAMIKELEGCPTDERCLTCGRTDAQYRRSAWTCVDPWHADSHLRRNSPTFPSKEPSNG